MSVWEECALSFYSEIGLPEYLQRDLDAFKEGIRVRSTGDLPRQFYQTYLEARREALFRESV